MINGTERKKRPINFKALAYTLIEHGHFNRRSLPPAKLAFHECISMQRLDDAVQFKLPSIGTRGRSFELASCAVDDSMHGNLVTTGKAIKHCGLAFIGI